MAETDHRASMGSALAYRDPRAAIEFLEEAFGFETALLIADQDGNLAHSELSFGNGYIMVGNEWAANIKSPASIGGANTQRVSVRLDSGIDAHCRRARAAGGRIVMEPEDQPYGARAYVCVDPEGHTWDFEQPVPVAETSIQEAGYSIHQLATPDAEQANASLFANAYYEDAKSAIDWLSRALGFEVQLILEGQDGLLRGHLGFGNCRVAINSELRRQGWPPRLSPRVVDGANTQTVHVQLTEGIDAHCERARKAGAEILQEPEDQFYGDRTYRLLDREGHMWTFGQTLRTLTPDQWDAASGLKTEVSR